MGRIKGIAALLAVMGVLACVKEVSAQGNITAAYNVEQAQGKAPVIKAYVNGRKVTGENIFSGKVSGADFAEAKEFVCEDTRRFADSKEGIHYIVLLDNSRSVDEKQFQQAKKELVKLCQGMSASDKMNLYTVGSDNSKGEKKMIVSAKGKEAGKKQIKRIQAIQRTKGQTVLYRSLTQVLATADNSTMRTIVLLITDGEDDSQGKDNRTYQVNPAVKTSCVPIYGILLTNISKNPNKEKMMNTRKNILEERVSRGYYEDCNSPGEVAAGFRNIKSILYKETYVVTLREENNSNRITLDARFSMQCDNQEIKLGKGSFTYNQIGENDTNPPVIKKIKKSGNRSIKFEMQDDKTKKLIGADRKENYVVKDKDGREWEIQRVNVNAAGNEYELIFKDKLYSGDYTIQCHNISDDSQEENQISKKSKFSFKGLNGNLEIVKKGVKTYWWIGLIFVVIVIGVLVVLVLKRKKNGTVELDVGAFVESDSRQVWITITDKDGRVRDIECNVEGSIFVGRSDICELHFDDDSLSKQHFVIEVTKMACYIEDLETTNATFVNGVKISGRRMLSDGDVIAAGRERFVFHTAGNRGGDES